MITLKGYTGNLEGLSTDQKPTDVPVNTEFRELDTNCRFYFTGESWEEIPSSGGGGGSGTSNYNELENKPQIAGVTLSGNKTLANLGIQGELSFDNAPTEDSTNPVTSGGVYEALEAKQDTLTIDDTPTEDSTNPVTSGGVYSALENKQDNLVFDGTYDSSTNKVATESTVSDAVSTAVGNLTNDNVGLGNVTNNTQIKALSGSVTSGGIVTFGADGATVSDSGKTIETNLSNSNDNVPTSKAVRDKVAGSATMASNYSTDSSESSITSASTINDAIEQLDYRTTTNKNNILLTADQSTQYNYMDFNSYGTGNSGTIDSINTTTNTITVSGKAAWAKGIIYLNNVPSGTYRLKYTVSSNSSASAAITMNEGSTQKTSKVWNNSTGDYTSGEITFGDNAKSLYVTANNSASSLSNSVSITITNVMLIPKSLYDAGFTDYQPYALPNTAITPALKECVDNGSKNKVYTDNSGTFTASGSARSYDIPVTVTGNVAISFGSLTSTDTDSDSCAIVFLNSSNVGFLTISMNRGSNVSQTVTLTDMAVKVRIYPANSYNESAGDTVTWNNLMICDESLWKVSRNYQPPALSNAELTAKEQQNKISFGFSGNPNPAVYVKDWDFVPDGTYLLTYICSQDASNRRGVSVYMFTKYTTNHIVLFTPVVEVSGAIITSCVASGSAGAETITFTMAQRGYHTGAAIQIQAF